MTTFPRVYGDDQRKAVQQAYADRNIRPARRICELAAEGALTCDGELIPAFSIKESTVRDIGRRFEQRRAGVRETPLADLAPRDAVEQLRRRLVSAADTSLSIVEDRAARKRQQPDPEQLRQLARAVREIAAIPTLDVPAGATKPGQHNRQEGRKDSGATRGGLAGQILASAASEPRGFDAAAEPVPGPLPPQPVPTYEETQTRAAPRAQTDAQVDAQDADGDALPGDYVRDQITRLTADRVSIRG